VRDVRWRPLLAFLAAGVLAACSDEPGATNGAAVAAAPGVRASTIDGVVSIAKSAAGEKSLARDAEPPRKGGTFVQAITAEYGTLNNILRYLSSEENLCRTYLFPPLLDVDPDTLELVPLLAAERPTISADHLTYTWKIRPGVKWHRGDERGPVEVTSADFEYSWRMLSNPAVRAEKARASLGPIAGVKAVDRHTFTVTATKPYFRIEFEFGFNFRLMPAHLGATDPDAFNRDPLGHAPVGYGPYRFAEWKDGEYVELERDPAWPFPDRLPYHFERYRIRFIPDSAQWPLFLERGEITLCPINDCSRWEEMKRDPAWGERATFHEYFLAQWLFMTWNTAHPALRDVRVRRALARLYPRDLVKEKVYVDHAAVLNAPASVIYDSYDATAAPAPFDPGEARRLLDEAGWSDHDGDGLRDKEGVAFRITLLHPSATVPAIATGNAWFQEQAKGAGVEIALQAADIKKMTADLSAHSFDAAILSWVGDPRDDDLYDRFHSRAIAEGSNYGGYSDPECDALLEEFRGEFDPARRVELAREIHRKLAADLPVLPLYNPQALVLVSTQLRNVKMHRLGARWFDWWQAP